MNLIRIAARVAASSTWFHATNKSLYESVLRDGLKKEADSGKWGGHVTGDGIYLVQSMDGAIEYAVSNLDVDLNDLMVIEVSVPGQVLMDEDDVAGGPGSFDDMPHPSEPFAEKYPDAYQFIVESVKSGTSPNDAKIQAIDKFKIPADEELMPIGQGSVGSLTGRYPGSIPSSNIHRIYFLDENGESSEAWPGTEPA